MKINRRKFLMTGFLATAAVLSGMLFSFSPPPAAVVTATEPQSGQKLRHLTCVGDSIAAGLGDNKGGWVRRFGRLSGFQVSDRTQPGATSLNALRLLEASKISRHDYVFIAVGVNDLNRYGTSDSSMVISSAQQREHFTALLEKAKAMTPHVIVVGTLPVDEKRITGTPAYFLRNEDVRAQNEMKQELSAEYGAMFIDPYEAFMNAGGLKLLEDGLHPNAAGHTWLAAFFGKQLARLV